MRQMIDEWKNWLTIDKSRRTVDGYVWQIDRLVEWLPPAYGWGNVRTADLTRYLAERRQKGIGECTVKHAVAAFRSFFGWMFKDKSPALGVPFPHPRKHKQRCLTQEQAFAVLTACNVRRPVGCRDLAMVCLMLDTGLRASEVCRLTLRDLDCDSRRLVVMIKGGDESVRAFSEYTASCLRQWLAIRWAAPECDTVFTGVGGNTPGEKLTPSGLKAIFRALAKRAGLAALSPHDLRRSFATLAHKRGAPSRLIQVAGGWDDIRQVETYTATLEASDLDPYSPVTGIMFRPLKS
jgi:integrase/recombinase XerD